MFASMMIHLANRPYRNLLEMLYERQSSQLLDETGKQLLTGAATSRPDAYNQAIHRGTIGPAVGSCGAAAYSGERVVVSDIKNHPYWTPSEAFEELLLNWPPNDSEMSLAADG